MTAHAPMWQPPISLILGAAVGREVRLTLTLTRTLTLTLTLNLTPNPEP